MEIVSIRRAPWADFNDNHLPFKRQPSIFRAANYHPKIFVAGKTERRNHWSGTHRIPVLRDVQTVVTVSYVYTKRDKSNRIIAGHPEIAEFSNVGELQVIVRR